MKKVSMVASRKIPYYAGREIQAEEEFECEDRHVRVMELLDLASRKKRQYKRRDMEAGEDS